MTTRRAAAANADAIAVFATEVVKDGVVSRLPVAAAHATGSCVKGAAIASRAARAAGSVRPDCAVNSETEFVHPHYSILNTSARRRIQRLHTTANYRGTARFAILKPERLGPDPFASLKRCAITSDAMAVVSWTQSSPAATPTAVVTATAVAEVV